MKTQTTVTLTEQERGDILVTAVEGGIGYWAGAERIDRTPEDGGQHGLHHLTIERADLYAAIEGERGTNSNPLITLSVTTNALDSAIDKVLRDFPNTDTAAQVRQSIATGDLDLDAEAADVIVQVAMFGTVVYG